MNYKIYDVSQELTSCVVYPGDCAPQLESVKNIANGDVYNLSNLKMCLHNGTHVDAPLHFLENGKDVASIPLSKFVGFCCVVNANDDIDKKIACNILESMRDKYPNSSKKILFKGNGVLSEQGAIEFALAGVELLGTELVSVGNPSAPKSVHDLLLQREIVLLEGLRLDDVEAGEYFINCAPLNISGAEGSPCRAILIRFY